MLLGDMEKRKPGLPPSEVILTSHFSLWKREMKGKDVGEALLRESANCGHPSISLDACQK